MSLQQSDIRLLASRVMHDVPEGGGGPTGTAIPFGASNAIFTDTTQADRAGGNVSIRQLHAGLLTPNTEALLGANVILELPPTDPNVSITLAACGLFARRNEIAANIAAYLIQSTEWPGYLLENHVAGMRNIQLLHRPGTAPPPVGRTLVLIYDEGKSTERSQYVRVTRVDTQARTFTYAEGGGFVDFQASVSQLDLSDALRFAFPGSPPSRGFARDASKTIIRDTTVADAATYYGATPLAAPAALGDSTMRVASVYSQLVPSARSETPTLDQRPAAARSITLATAPRPVEVAVAAHTRRIPVGQENRGYNYVAQLKPLPAPGTLVVSYLALGTWYTLADDGTGTLAGSGSGRVSYESGSVSVTLQAMPDAGSIVLLQWGERVAYTDRSAQGAQIRTPEIAWQLQRPGVKRGSVQIHWTSAGVLRTATDNGAGKLAGDASGSIDYPSGSIVLRTAWPLDAGGEFSTTYDAAEQQEQVFSGVSVDAAGMATLTLAQQPLAGSIEVAWITAQEVSSTSGGTLTAAGAGKSAANVATLTGYTRQPRYIYGGGTDLPAGQGYVGDSLPPTEWVEIPVYRYSTDTTSSALTRSTVQDATSARRVLTQNLLTDDGAGGFVAGMGSALYAAKTVTVKLVLLDKSTQGYKSDYENAKAFETTAGASSTDSDKGGDYTTSAVGEQLVGTVVVRYQVGPLAATSATESFSPPAVAIDLCPFTADRIVPGSVRFTWLGQAFDDVEGVLYRGRTPSAPGIASGSIDYARGIATLTDYMVPTNGAAAAGVTLQSLWTQRAPWTTASVFFRTQAAPLKPTGLTVSVLDTAGTALQATAALDGTLSGPHMRGTVDAQTGTAELQFGDYVDDAALTAAEKSEWWYSGADVGAVQPGKVWRPWPVDPSTLRYNSVAYFYLPLNADILGLDPVRLPQDGRVPIFRVGSYVVVGHTATLAPATYTTGNRIDTGRPRLSRVELIGGDGKPIAAGYTADLDAGTLQVTDAAQWVQPVRVRHRIEQMARVSDVQIDGTLKLTKQLSHDYPVGTVVSSALMAGNLHARALPVWDRVNWSTGWADTAGGSDAPSNYNDGAYPVEVTNAGALTERFALRVLSGGMDVEVIGEHVGNVGTFSRNTDIAPINPISGVPYFRLQALGWGGGWAAGNVLFLSTVGAYYPFAAIRTVQPSEATATDYTFEILARGDTDRPPTTVF